MPENLSLKEKLAIELKYLGNSYSEISEKIEVPLDTIKGWFEANGKLHQEYLDYEQKTDEKRQKEIETTLIESDENILVITTNIMRQVGLKIKDNNAKLDVADFERAWKIQRIMRGLPVDYQKREVNASIDYADEITKKLGLTSEDFKDENFDKTIKRITDYYRNSESVSEQDSLMH